jgi:hypothetical protein
MCSYPDSTATKASNIKENESTHQTNVGFPSWSVDAFDLYTNAFNHVMKIDFATIQAPLSTENELNHKLNPNFPLVICWYP